MVGNSFIKIKKLLKNLYPSVQCGLVFKNTLQLIVATILSAQCTDERVNIVTKKLFKKYKTAKDFASANPEELESYIKSAGLYKNKAKNIIGCCQELAANFNGKVPNTMSELVSLPGVGRKTANVVLGNGFGIAEGIAVDTHVKRVSKRLGLTKEEDPNKIEQDLVKIFEQQEWIWVNHALIAHGRQICDARTPKCNICKLSSLCSSSTV